MTSRVRGMPVAIAAAICGCGGGAPAVDVAGTWLGTDVGSLTRTATMVLQQSGRAIHGTYGTEPSSPIEVPLQGVLSGSVEGRRLSFTIEITTRNCVGNLTGTAEVDTASSPQRMSGSYSGTQNCVHNPFPVSNALTLVRQ